MTANGSFSSKEKKYAHYVSEASWAGARIIQSQWTQEAPALYDLLILTFSDNGKLANLEELKTKSGVEEDDWQSLLQYSSQAGLKYSLMYPCIQPTDVPIGPIQPSQLQIFRFFKDHSPHLRGQVCSCCPELCKCQQSSPSLGEGEHLPHVVNLIKKSRDNMSYSSKITSTQSAQSRALLLVNERMATYQTTTLESLLQTQKLLQFKLPQRTQE